MIRQRDANMKTLIIDREPAAELSATHADRADASQARLYLERTDGLPEDQRNAAASVRAIARLGQHHGKNTGVILRRDLERARRDQ
jgi:hypothetical protein